MAALGYAVLLFPYALLALALRFLAREARSVRTCAATSIFAAIGARRSIS